MLFMAKEIQNTSSRENVTDKNCISHRIGAWRRRWLGYMQKAYLCDKINCNHSTTKLSFKLITMHAERTWKIKKDAYRNYFFVYRIVGGDFINSLLKKREEYIINTYVNISVNILILSWFFI